MQTCKGCKQPKPPSEYPIKRWRLKDGTPREGPRKVCYSCMALADRKRYANPDSPRKTSHRAYKQKNADAIASYRKQYYEKNRDRWLNRETGWRFSPRAKAYDLEYRSNPENIARKNAYDRQWRLDNRPRLLLKTLGRLEKVRLATPSWVTREMLLPFYEASKRMQQLTGIVHHVDHYYPLVSDVVCGLHVPANLRVIPAIANLSKGTKIPE